MIGLALRALATGLLVRGAFVRIPGFDLLGWLALAPAFYDLAKSRSYARSAGAAAAHGFAAGCGFWSWVLWIGELKGTPASLLWRILLIGATTMALSLIASALAERAARVRFGKRAPQLPALAAAAAWTACEYGWSAAFVGATHCLAWSQWSRPAVIQVADLAGQWGVSFALVLASYGLGAAAAGARRAWAPGAAALALILGYGAWRLERPVPTRPGPELALLQGAWWPARSASPDALKQEVSEVYLPLARSAAGAGLVVWPESSVPVLQGGLEDVSFPLGEGAARETGSPQLFGASLPGPGGDRLFNSAVLLGADGGRLALYHRRFPMPFGEYVPGPLKWFIRGTISGETVPGRLPAVIRLPKGPDAGLELCGESLQSSLSRGLVDGGALVLFSLANSLWTGDTAGTTMTYAILPFLAVENHVSVVRVDTMGPTAVWGPDGRRAGWLPFGERGVLRARLPISLAPGSFYSRSGDWLPWLCALFALGVLAAARLKRAD
jgi:apolipoprotein N-acyltransferase